MSNTSNTTVVSNCSIFKLGNLAILHFTDVDLSTLAGKSLGLGYRPKYNTYGVGHLHAYDKSIIVTLDTSGLIQFINKYGIITESTAVSGQVVYILA